MYREYITESLRNLSENVARGFGVEGSVYMVKSYRDILNPVEDENEEESKAEQSHDIVDNIKRKLRGY